jgi:hypothetical protein
LVAPVKSVPMDEYPRVEKDEQGRLVFYEKPPDTRVEDTIRGIGAFLNDIATMPAREVEAMRAAEERVRKASEHAIAAKARRDAEAVARDEAMLRELATVRQALYRAEQREAAANARAEAAEERDAKNQADSAKREKFMMALTVISTVAAVVAIVFG